ncbi:MAG: hypothetical protein U0703_06300 [Anaerolineae bacterium]
MQQVEHVRAVLLHQRRAGVEVIERRRLIDGFLVAETALKQLLDFDVDGIAGHQPHEEERKRDHREDGQQPLKHNAQGIALKNATQDSPPPMRRDIRPHRFRWRGWNSAGHTQPLQHIRDLGTKERVSAPLVKAKGRNPLSELSSLRWVRG